MRVLVTGATGFVGQAIVEALLAAGHVVVAAVRSPELGVLRPQLEYRKLDYMHATEPAQMVELVDDVDALVNAVGIIRETKQATFQKLHAETPISLFAAAQQAGLKKIVQISAAGTRQESAFAYFTSKAKADEFLLSKCSVPAVVLRPSFVFGHAGEATALFRQLASLPLVPLPAGGQFSFSPILVEDLAQLVLEAITRRDLSSAAVDVGGAEEMTLREILLAMRAGTRPDGQGKTVVIPKILMKPAAWFGDWTGAGPLTSDMLEMLVTSDAPDLTDMHRIFHFRPQGLAQYLARSTRPKAHSEGV